MSLALFYGCILEEELYDDVYGLVRGLIFGARPTFGHVRTFFLSTT